MQRGKYFRIAADVMIDGEDLGELLVEAGMVFVMMAARKPINCAEKTNEN
jgi:endonuclease YncB( thermonuclease family)